VALTTLIASTATAPFAVYNFNRFAAFALAANLIAVPLTSLFVMPAAVIAFCLMPFGLEALALVPMGWGLGGVIWVAETVAAWPGSVVLLPALPALGIGLVALGGLWLCLWRGGWRYWGTLGIAAGLAGFALVRPPDILVDGAGKLFAVRGGAGNYLVSSRRGARFTRETWLRRAGQGPAAAPEWPRRGSALNGRLACDGLGCIYRRHGLEVALVHDPLALMEDCRRADLVISRVPVLGACPSAMAVIDRFDLWRKGGHAVWIGPRGFRIESVAQRRGRRPWVLSRAKGRAGEVP
jgi:competence protein ComEC